jgi:adenosine kinase
MKAKILVSGTLAYDRIMNFPGYFKDQIMPEKIHILNVSFFVQDLKEGFGGTAGNIAYNLTLLEEKPTILANAGAKDFSVYKKWLLKHKIDLSQVKILAQEQTASAYIITDQADNQITGFFPGATRQPISRRRLSLGCATLAIVSPQNPIDMVKLPLFFQKQEIPYIFDPGQQVTTLTGSQLKKAIIGSKVLIGNDYEISLISKKTNWQIGQLLKKTEILITTLGSKGSIIKQDKKTYRIPPAKPKNTSDPTGAGDAYRAGLIKGLLENWPLQKIGRFAGVVSVYTVELYGTQTHKFTWASLAKRYKQNFGEKL